MIVVSGPSGAGKTSVVEGLSHNVPFHFSVSMTTRAARPGEVDGRDYYFVDDAMFDDAIESGRLAEWATYGGNRYGTPADHLERQLAAGNDVLLDIEIEGVKQARRLFPDATYVFIAPPSLASLRERLEARGDTNEAEIVTRISVASGQMEQSEALFDHVVVNEELSSAIAQLTDILSDVPDPSDS